MIIAQIKKRENIVEYLLYMWQIEDLIRANRFNANEVRATLISQYDQPAELKEEIMRWYMNIIETMQTEGVVESGHIQSNCDTVNELTELHRKLLKLDCEQIYKAKYDEILPLIVQLRAKAGGSNVGEIETCLTALYVYSTLKLQKREVSQSTSESVKRIATFLSMLAEKYREKLDNK